MLSEPTFVRVALALGYRVLAYVTKGEVGVASQLEPPDVSYHGSEKLVRPPKPLRTCYVTQSDTKDGKYL